MLYWKQNVQIKSIMFVYDLCFTRFKVSFTCILLKFLFQTKQNNSIFLLRIQDGLLVVWRRFVLRINGQHPLDTLVPHLLQLLPLAVLAGVQPLAVRGVDRLRGGRPATRQRLSSGHNTQLVIASHSANWTWCQLGRRGQIAQLTVCKKLKS